MQIKTKSILISILITSSLIACGDDDFGDFGDTSDSDVETETGESDAETETGDSADSTGMDDGDEAPTEFTLSVSLNLQSATFLVLGVGNQVVADMAAADCPLDMDYFACEVSGLEPGAYIVEFDDVPGYQTPAPVVVNLDETTEVFGDYLPE